MKVRQLNEYSEGELKRLIAFFKEQADDFNIDIGEEDLKKVIQRFDAIKNGPNIKDKEIRNYNLRQLLKLVRSAPGGEKNKEADTFVDTPDIIYNENGIIIYAGHKEGNCVLYGDGEKWCITRGSFSGYRLGQKEKTFYLVKDTNKEDSNKDSFFVIHMNKNGSYQWTDRSNSPHESSEMEWSGIVERFPVLNGLERYFNYIPVSVKEKSAKAQITYQEWVSDLDFTEKKEYIVLKQNITHNSLFSDISDDVFFVNKLTKLPKLEEWICRNPVTSLGVTRQVALLQHIESLSKENATSLLKNSFNIFKNETQVRKILDLGREGSNRFPFIVYLYAAKQTDIHKNWSNSNVYVFLNDKGEIYYLKGNDYVGILSIFAEDYSYPKVKINNRTAKYIFNDQTLEVIPPKYLIATAKRWELDISKIKDKILSKGKTIEIEGSNYTVDDSDLSILKTEGNQVRQINASRAEDVPVIKKILGEDEEFQQSFLDKMFLNRRDTAHLPEPYLSSAANLGEILGVIPTDKLVRENLYIAYGPDGTWVFNLDLIKGTGANRSPTFDADYNWPVDGASARGHTFLPQTWNNLFTRMRENNQSFTSSQIMELMKRQYMSNAHRVKYSFIAGNPPIEANPRYRPSISDDTAYLINTADPSQSFKISSLTGKLVKANIRTGGGRGRRPAGQAAPQQATAPQAAQAPPAATQPVTRWFTQYGIRYPQINPRQHTTYRTLHRRFLDRNGTSESAADATDRGASRRNNILGPNGHVVRIITVDQSKGYVIRLANDSYVMSVVIQPGNMHFLITTDGRIISLNSPAELLRVLMDRNLAESIKYLSVKEFTLMNPHLLEETTQIVKKLIEFKK